MPSEYPSSDQRQLFANTTATLRNVAGMMDDDAIAIFEETGLVLLIDKFPRMEAFEIEFLFLHVEGQMFRHEDGHGGKGDLTVYLQISANITPGEPNGFDFQTSMESFFDVHEDLLASRLDSDGVVFQSNSIQEEGTVQKPQETQDEPLNGFLTTGVIVGITVSMATLLVIGSFVLSRPMWRRNDRYSLESPGRLGAAPSEDSEDLDPQSIFMSFSHGRKEGTAKQMPIGETSGRSQQSHYTSSTSGSHLVSSYLSPMSD